MKRNWADLPFQSSNLMLRNPTTYTMALTSAERKAKRIARWALFAEGIAVRVRAFVEKRVDTPTEKLNALEARVSELEERVGRKESK